MIKLERAATIVVDVQNDFCHQDGWAAQKGLDTSGVDRAMPYLDALLAAARRAAMPIVFIQLVRDDADPGAKRKPTKPPRACQRGTWGSEFTHVAPLPGEYVVQKSHHSAFYQTNLDELLESLDVDTLVFTGFSTNVCVESSLRDAFQRDYAIIAVSDCTAAYDESAHIATLANVTRHFGIVATADEVIAAMAEAGENAFRIAQPTRESRNPAR